jgi:maltose O-acetyltransferase
MLRHIVNLILWPLPPTRLFRFRNMLLRLAGISLHPTVAFCGRGWVYGRGKLVIGEKTWLSPGVVIHTHTDVQISIGDKCDFGPGVQIITGSHKLGNQLRRAGLGTASAVRVGNGVWIGASSIILGGVSIGNGAIVAAGSCVTKNVDPNTMVAGVPARIKKHLLT